MDKTYHPDDATRIDVAVVGGGPAGVATALALGRAGRRVAVIERTDYRRARIGETLPPRARPLLAALDLPTNLERDGHIPAPGIVTAWGHAEPRSNDFIMNPYGHGWHLDRRHFDRTLAALARDCDIALYERTAVTACATEDAGWRIGLRSPEGDVTMTCRFLVDATGRAASTVKRRAGRRTVHDRLIGLAAFTTAAHSDRRTLIESAAGGWWYSALLPGDRHVAVYMTDADTVRCRRSDLTRFFRSRLRDAPLTRERCGDLTGLARVEPYPAMTHACERVCGENWMLVGDAAMAWDPLSGQGICKALDSGIRAARAIDPALDGDRRGLANYERWTQAQFSAYLGSRARYYQAESRWPDNPFWRRRRTNTTAPHESRGIA